MHLKFTKHGRFCKQNNQLPCKSHDELEDDTNISNNLKIACHNLDGAIVECEYSILEIATLDDVMYIEVHV